MSAVNIRRIDEQLFLEALENLHMHSDIINETEYKQLKILPHLSYLLMILGSETASYFFMD